jgi:hypothetical protein
MPALRFRHRDDRRGPASAAITSTTSVVGCCAAAVDRHEIELDVAETYWIGSGRVAVAVTCDGGLPVREGAAVSCQILQGDATVLHATATVTDVANGRVSYDVVIEPWPSG